MGSIPGPGRCHSRGAIKPRYHNYWSSHALGPERLNYCSPPPRPCGPQEEKTSQWGACVPQLESSSCSATKERPGAATKTLRSQKSILKIIFISILQSNFRSLESNNKKKLRKTNNMQLDGNIFLECLKKKKDVFYQTGGSYKISFLFYPNFIFLYSRKLKLELLYGLFSSVPWVYNIKSKSGHYLDSSQRWRTLGLWAPAFTRASIILPRKTNELLTEVMKLSWNYFSDLKINKCIN